MMLLLLRIKRSLLLLGLRGREASSFHGDGPAMESLGTETRVGSGKNIKYSKFDRYSDFSSYLCRRFHGPQGS